MNRRYSLRETDNILRSIYSDYSLLKRYLIDDGFFDRTPDGREYWRIFLTTHLGGNDATNNNPG